jgi:hypothetical protein
MITRRLGLGILFLLFAAAAWAADVSGTWKGDVSSPDGNTFSLTYTFKQDGAKLTGTVLSPHGDELPLAVNAVEFQGVSKSYAIYESPGDRLKELLSFNRLKRHTRFLGPARCHFESARRDLLHRRRERLRQEHAAANGGRHSATHQRDRRGERARFGAARTGRRLQSRIQRARQRLPERLHPRPHHRQIDQRYRDIEASPKSASSSTSR